MEVLASDPGLGTEKERKVLLHLIQNY
jgi:hypothetical protein